MDFVQKTQAKRFAFVKGVQTQTESNKILIFVICAINEKGELNGRNNSEDARHPEILFRRSRAQGR